MIHLETFQGHIVLYCKGHYHIPEEGFFEGLKMIWAIRCGYDYGQCSSDVLGFIANDMHEIIQKTSPNSLHYLMDTIHRELSRESPFKPENMSPIEALIWEYRGFLSNLKVKERDPESEEFITLVELPKPNPKVFNRILKSEGEYEDYERIKG